MENWTAIHIQIPCELVDQAAAITQMVVPYGIYIEDYTNLEEQVEQIAHIDLIDEDLLKKDRTKAIIHVYIDPTQNPMEAVSFLRERFESEAIPYQIDTEGVKERIGRQLGKNITIQFGLVTILWYVRNGKNVTYSKAM